MNKISVQDSEQNNSVILLVDKFKNAHQKNKNIRDVIVFYARDFSRLKV